MGARPGLAPRLRHAGLSLDEARRRLAGLASAERAPSWPRILGELRWGERETRDVRAPRVPFGEALVPFVRWSRDALAAVVGSRAPELPPDLGHDLLDRLSWIAGRALQQGFSVEQGASASSAIDARYRRYLDHLREGGFEALLQRLPVLARLLATQCERWVESTAELLARLDEARLQAPGCWGLLRRPLEAIEAPGFRTHGGGRGVRRLRFRGGASIIYRPVAVTLDRAFAGLAAWLAERAPLPALRTAAVMEGDGWGFQRDVRARPCRSPAALERYALRAGALLALTWLLGAVDLHAGNLVAQGEHPILVDLETLLHPRLPGPMPAIRSTLLATGLLRLPDGDGPDVSGFTGHAGQATSVRVGGWTAINTDAMRWEVAPVVTPEEHNRPVLQGAPQDLRAQAAAIEAGFSAVVGVFQRQHRALAAPDGPLAAFAGAETCFVFRAGQLYRQLLERCLDPRLLEDGADRSIELDFLVRPLLAEPALDGFWPLVPHEHAALERLDLPRFTATVTGRDLTLAPGVRLEGCFAGSAWADLLARLDGLDERCLDEQRDLLRASLATPQDRSLAHAPG